MVSRPDSESAAARAQLRPGANVARRAAYSRGHGTATTRDMRVRGPNRVQTMHPRRGAAAVHLRRLRAHRLRARLQMSVPQYCRYLYLQRRPVHRRRRLGMALPGRHASGGGRRARGGGCRHRPRAATAASGSRRSRQDWRAHGANAVQRRDGHSASRDGISGRAQVRLDPANAGSPTAPPTIKLRPRNLELIPLPPGPARSPPRGRSPERNWRAPRSPSITPPPGPVLLPHPQRSPRGPRSPSYSPSPTRSHDDEDFWADYRPDYYPS